MKRPTQFGPLLPGRPTMALPDCEKCGNERYPGGKACDCVIVARANMYYGPSLANLPYLRPADGFDPAGLETKNVLIQNSAKWSDREFNRDWRAALKAHLSHHKLRIPFLVCSGAREVVDALFHGYDRRRGEDEIELNVYEQMQSVPLLVLFLAGDPRNEQYATMLPQLLRYRVAEDLQTWVVTTYSLMPDDKAIANLYGIEFANYIRPRLGNERPGIGGGEFHLLDLAQVHAAFTRQLSSTAGTGATV